MLLPSVSNNRGSVIITSVLLAGVLLVVGLGISQLISREIRLKQNVIEEGKSYYNAEAGVETALLASRSHVVGFEAKDVLKNDGALNYKYSIDARDSGVDAIKAQVPCHNRKEISSEYRPIGTTDTLWRKLPLQQSIALPLFTSSVDAQGTETISNFDSFSVEYWVNVSQDMEDQNNTGNPPSQIQTSDVLRWKLLALDGSGNTVSMSDYLPVVDDVGNLHNTYYNPAKFGSSTTGKYYSPSANDSSVYEFEATFSIQHFLRTEIGSKPYLILTNVVNIPPEIPIYGTKEIYFRMIKNNDTDPNFVCDYVKVVSDGYSGTYRQSLDVEMKLDSFLPVFDFALYRTVGN